MKPAGIAPPGGMEGVNLLDDKAVSGRPAVFGEVFTHNAVNLRDPASSLLYRWAVAGDWTIERGLSVVNGAEGRLAFRFHARDVNLVMGPRPKRSTVPFRVTIDGEPPGDSAGFDVDETGHGTLSQQRLHQLVRQRGPIADRTCEITFLAPGAEAYCFTFG